MQSIREAIARRLLILDGAIATMLPRGGYGDLLTLNSPHLVEDLHRGYVDAGADIITTNTLNSNQLQMPAGTDITALNRRAAEIARRAAGSERWVAGSVGPTMLMLSREPSDDSSLQQELYAAYRQQIAGLIAGGVDLLLIETITDHRNARVAVDAAHAEMAQTGVDLPIVISASLTADDLLICGATYDQLMQAIAPLRPLAIGVNCGASPRVVARQAADLKRFGLPVAAYPSLGIPDASGDYPVSADEFVAIMRPLDVAIKGGCCGTTPQIISRLAESAGV